VTGIGAIPTRTTTSKSVARLAKRERVRVLRGARTRQAHSGLKGNSTQEICREMKGGRKSESTLQRAQQGFSLQEISYEKEFTQPKYCFGRFFRFYCHIGPIEPLRKSSTILTGRGNASGSEVHVSDDSGGPNGEGREICAPKRFDQDRFRRHRFD